MGTLGIPDSVMPHIRRFGFSGAAALAVVVVMLFGINPITVLTGQTAGPPPLMALTGIAAARNGEATPEEFTLALARDADAYWTQAFFVAKLPYGSAAIKAVLTAGDLGCGMAGSSVGTFYCPAERAVYVDLSSLDRLRQQVPDLAPEAFAYALGRAFAHHTQNEVGVFKAFAAARGSMSADDRLIEEQRLSAQAACYIAVWAAYARIDQTLADPALAELGEDDRLASLLPSRADLLIPELLAPASRNFRQHWFGAGQAIPAGGTCKLELIGRPSLGASVSI